MTKRNQIAALVMFLTVGLTACGAETPLSSAVPSMAPQPSLPAASAPLPSASAVPEDWLPVASGVLREENEKAAVDHSNTGDGYVMARWSAPTDKKIKVRVTGPSTEYLYDLAPEEWTAFPLSDGSGSYCVAVYENVEGTSYTTALTVSFDAALSSPFAPFLRPNQYVDYTDAPQTIQKARELTQGLTDSMEKVERIYAFVVEKLSYDELRAETVQSGYLPELDKVMEEGKGICWDYAALMTAMVRSQEIPCRLVVGDAGTAYHAWVSVWDGGDWVRMDPTFADSGKDTGEVEYTGRYFY